MAIYYYITSDSYWGKAPRQLLSLWGPCGSLDLQRLQKFIATRFGWGRVCFRLHRNPLKLLLVSLTKENRLNGKIENNRNALLCCCFQDVALIIGGKRICVLGNLGGCRLYAAGPKTLRYKMTPCKRRKGTSTLKSSLRLPCTTLLSIHK